MFICDETNRFLETLVTFFKIYYNEIISGIGLVIKIPGKRIFRTTYNTAYIIYYQITQTILLQHPARTFQYRF